MTCSIVSPKKRAGELVVPSNFSRLMTISAYSKVCIATCFLSDTCGALSIIADTLLNFYQGVTRAVDLCAAPGSWSQVLSRKLKPDKSSTDEVKIVAVDIQTMAPIEGVDLIQGDITRSDTAERVISHFKGAKAQLVVCDGAPDVTGQHDLDEFMQSQLIFSALNITSFIIEDGGTFVAKIFRGKDISLMIAQLRLFFKQVQVVKPKSSRASSIEAFVVCLDFQLPPEYQPLMFDMHSTMEEQSLSDRDSERGRSLSLLPFLMCGDLSKPVQQDYGWQGEIDHIIQGLARFKGSVEE